MKKDNNNKNTVPQTAESGEKKHHSNHKQTQAEQKNTPQYSFKAVFIVVEHGYADDICEFLFENSFRFNLAFQGKGTANSQLLNLLGLGDSTRDIILSMVEADKARELIEKVNAQFETTGVIFSVRLNSIGGRKIIKILQGDFTHVDTNK